MGLSHSGELDLLVPQWEIRRAQECLETMGWCRGAEYFALSPRQWEENFQHELSHRDPRVKLAGVDIGVSRAIVAHTRQAGGSQAWTGGDELPRHVVERFRRDST